MNYKFLLLSAVFFAACGDDSSSVNADASENSVSGMSSSSFVEESPVSSGGQQGGLSSIVSDGKSSSSVAYEESDTEFIDSRDGKVYPIVDIKVQRWLGRNMDYASDSSWCYNDVESNCDKLGRSYTWESAKDACPEGWKLPSIKDWRLLLNLSSSAGLMYYGALNDVNGFHLLKVGHYSEENDSLVWNGVNEDAYFWASEEIDDEYGAFAHFYSKDSYAFVDKKDGGYVLMKKSYKQSVRCIRENKGTMTDPRDGQTYKTIRLGNKIWMAENLNFAADSSVEYVGDADFEKTGRFYKHSAALTACPAGWHLPSTEEWKNLLYLGDTTAIGGAFSLKSSFGWNEGSGADVLEFTAVPVGNCIDDPTVNAVSCYRAGEIAYFWTGSEYAKNDKYECVLIHSFSNINTCGDYEYNSIRCVKD